jgi:3-phosphoshikimate 1-carboxyvinyltransferase
MAAIAPDTMRIERPLASDDTAAMIGCLRQLGVAIACKDTLLEVTNNVKVVQNKDYKLNARLSGITMRFLLALSCTLPGMQTLYGHEGLNNRPIGDLVDGLRQLGATIEYLERDGFPPVRVTSTSLRPGTVRMPGGVSSQFFSAVLMVAPRIAGDITIEVIGEQISKPYIVMTIDTMQQFGVHVQNEQYRAYHVRGGQQYTMRRYEVEGDISSAAYFFAIAVLTHSTITVQNVNPQSKQADMQFLHILEQMGAEVTSGQQSITVHGHGVRALDVDMQDCPDQAMTVAALAACAPGTTIIRGVQSLRVKETERVVAVEHELAKLGITAESTPDTLTIHGGQPHDAHIDTYGDHRMAMAFAVLGTKLPGIVINNPGVVGKTFPGFWEALTNVTTAPPARNIVLIGMRGSGKNTIGALLAKRLGLDFIDIDKRVVLQTGQSIPKMVAEHSWEYFRDQESAAVLAASTQNGVVIATGGGTILRPENVTALREQGTLVLLTAPPRVLAQRIAGDANRPALTQQESLEAELTQVWNERRDHYQRAADLVVSTETNSPEAVAIEIERRLKTQGNDL